MEVFSQVIIHFYNSQFIIGFSYEHILGPLFQMCNNSVLFSVLRKKRLIQNFFHFPVNTLEDVCFKYMPDET